MNNFTEQLLIIVVLLFIVVPITFIRIKYHNRLISAQESIAESLKKIADNQLKVR